MTTKQPPDDDIWLRLASTLKPLAKRAAMPHTTPAKIIIKRQVEPAVLATAPQKNVSHWHNLHRREQKRLGRGTQAPEAVLDLHGLTLPVAHQRLRQFIGTSIAAKHRLVLVITGKGPISEGGGALRRALPLWLHDTDLNPFVIGFNNAHGKHGGLGAFYVVLRSNA